MVDPRKSNNDVIKAVRQESGHMIVNLQGEVDMHRSMDVRDCLLEILSSQPDILLIDLADVSFMDSTGLATLVEALQISRRKSIRLKVTGIQPQVRAVFEIARLDSLFDIYETESEGLAQ